MKPGEEEPATSVRKVYLPLSKIERCASSSCQKTSEDAKLRLCAACGEAAYCSSECQKNDWKSHKVYCGKTDRIDLQSYYPFLAAIAQISHVHPDIDIHPAMRHKIINSPNPNGGDIVDLPNGTSAKLVLLGEEIPQAAVGSKTWWPTGFSDSVRHKFLRRILNEGLQLPITLAICIALASEIYTTTAVPASEEPDSQFSGRRRIRLSYNHSPIKDFGVVHGSVRVTNQDRLAYYNIETDEFLMGQDPDDHYWIYFTTLAGDEYFLDAGMMTFNFCTVVDSSPYCKFGLPDLSWIPAFFYGHEHEKAMPLIDRLMWKPRKRFSILRESRLYKMLGDMAVEYCECHDVPLVGSIMDEIAGHKCSEWEKEMVMTFLPNAVKLLRLNVQNREYLNFPKEPGFSIETDPNEAESKDSEKEEELTKYLTKWARRLKKGKITPERWEAAFSAWRKQPFAARTKHTAK